MVDRSFILANVEVEVNFEYDPVTVAIDVMDMLDSAETYPGMADWVGKTYNALTEDQRQVHRVAMKGVSGWIKHSRATRQPYESIDQLIQAIESADEEVVQNVPMQWMFSKDNFPGKQEILEDKYVFLRFIEKVLEEKGETDYHMGDWADFHRLLNHPEEMRDILVKHIKSLWGSHIKAEIERTRPMLEKSVAAYQQMDYSGLSRHEIVESVTGRSFRDIEFFDKHIRNAKVMTFLPSPHLGPYVAVMGVDDIQECLVFFGARLPKNTSHHSPELSRSELLVRLNALADDTRLQILELIHQHGELCAQDVITQLNLSQSSASRHLRQLRAAGYLIERRREVAKCYTLNPERFQDTANALSNFIGN